MSDNDFTTHQCRKALTISTWEGSFASFHGALIGGVFVTGFVLDLGAQNIHLAILTAIITLAGFAQLLSAWYLQYLPARKPFTIITSNISRFSWLLIALVPFLFIKSNAMLIFFIIYLVLNMTMAMAGNSWTSWMADTVPKSLYGRYFSRRTMICTIVAGVSGLTGGYFMDNLLPKYHKELLNIFSFLIPSNWSINESYKFIGFGMVYFVAVLLGALPSLILLIKQPEPPFRKESTKLPLQKKPLFSYIKEIVNLPNFRTLVLAMVIWNIVNGFSSPFWTPFRLRDLEMSYSALTFCDYALNGMFRVIALPFWGKIIDRFGSKSVLLFTLYVTSFHPLFYVISTPDFTALIYLDAISSGIMWAGVEMALFTLLLSTAPKQGREMFLAIYAALTALSATIPQFIAGWIMDIMQNYQIFSISSIQILLWFVSVGRFGSLMWINKITDPKEKPIVSLVSHLFTQVKEGFGFFRLFT
jgi:MFS family permease